MRLPPSWVNELTPESPYTLPMLVPETLGLSTVGYVPHTDSLPISAQARYDIEPVAHRIIKAEYDPTSFGISKPSMLNVIKATKKYDFEPFVPDLSVLEVLQNEIFPEVVSQYAPIWRSCRVLPFTELKFVAKTSPGPIFKWAGCRDKLDAIKRFRSYLEWYVDGSGYRSCEPSLWKENGKIELLKASKLVGEQDGIRGFTVPPIDEFLLQAKYCQDFNEKMDILGADPLSDFMPAVGVNLRGGAWFQLMDKIDSIAKNGGAVSGRRGKVLEGDLVKFDSTEWSFLLENARLVREKCWDQQSSPTEFKEAMDHIYHENIKTYIQLPNGQVVQKSDTMPSGSILTSNDGCNVHWPILMYHWRRVTDRPPSQMRQFVFGKLYCDDHIAGVDGDFADAFCSFKERSRSYELCGTKLSQADDLVTDSTESHNFLGFKQRGGVPVPYKPNKFWNSLVRPDGPRDIHTGLQRAVSAMDNGCFDDQMYAQARVLATEYQRLGAVFTPNDDIEVPDYQWIPSQKSLQKRWMGYEQCRAGL